LRLWQLAARQARRPWLSVSLSARPNHAHLRQRYGGAVVTETVFSLPGVGLLLTDSILGKELPTVQAIVLFLTVAVVLTSFIVDLVYGLLDPGVTIAHG
jgi:ABC-type dipeptide/oligopeptide/nickel transport system permease component